MGLFFYSREAYDLAIGEFRRALKIALFPMAGLHVNLGAAYLGKKMYAEAQASLLTGLRLEPDNQKAHWFLARTLQIIGRLEEAAAEFEKARAIDPESPEGRQAQEELRALSAAMARSAPGGPR